MRTSGHHVVITGASRGIGLALARQFHAAGNEVVLVGRDESALRAAAASLPGARCCVADMARAEDRKRLSAEVGDLSVLVNNAGVQHNGELAAMAEAQIENELAVNLLAPVLLTHAFLPLLRKHPEAAIVNVSSVLALAPKESASVYCASKAAIRSFTRTLRWQLEKTGVRVFEIMPPLVDTAMTAGRGQGKISPDAVAREFWAGFAADRFEIRIGKARAAAPLIGLLPALGERLMRGDPS